MTRTLALTRARLRTPDRSRRMARARLERSMRYVRRHRYALRLRGIVANTESAHEHSAGRSPFGRPEHQHSPQGESAMPDHLAPHLNAVPPPRGRGPHHAPQPVRVGRRPTGEGSATGDIFAALAIAGSLALLATVALGVAIPVGLLPLGALAAFTLVVRLRETSAPRTLAGGTRRKRQTLPFGRGSGESWRPRR
jgi:hypothetical protein